MFNEIIPETQVIFATVAMGFALVAIVSAIGYVVRDMIRNAFGLINE